MIVQHMEHIGGLLRWRYEPQLKTLNGLGPEVTGRGHSRQVGKYIRLATPGKNEILCMQV